MAGETKNEAFHRLAGQRVDKIEDALRVFSNLSGPSYDFAEAEARAYLDRIEAALHGAHDRFAEARKWPPAAEPAPASEPEPEIRPEPEAKPGLAPSARELAMLAIWREPRSEEGALLEQLAMQREVIAGQQRQLDQYRINGGTKS